MGRHVSTSQRQAIVKPREGRLDTLLPSPLFNRRTVSNGGQKKQTISTECPTCHTKQNKTNKTNKHKPKHIIAYTPHYAHEHRLTSEGEINTSTILRGVTWNVAVSFQKQTKNTYVSLHTNARTCTIHTQRKNLRMTHKRRQNKHITCTYLERGCLIPDRVEAVVLDDLGGLGLPAVGWHTVHRHDHVRVDDLALLSPTRLRELSTAHHLQRDAGGASSGDDRQGKQAHATNDM